MVSIEGHRIVSAKEMARVEKLSIEAGASAEGYMMQAGKGIAERIQSFILERELEKEVTLLVGKGNNGGDAYVAGRYLREAGYRVRAYHFFPFEEGSPLCQKEGASYVSCGGEVIYPASMRDIAFFSKGVIVDGLFGTGFQGILEGLLAKLATTVNDLSIPVIAIDIPSGVNGDTGEVGECALRAEETLFLGVPKWGFFIGEGADYIGGLKGVDFGLDLSYLRHMRTEAYLLNEKGVRACLPHLKRSQHKYEAGYVLALAGSPGMPGAAMLSCLAALRSGAGMVRLFHPDGMEGELSTSPYELIRTPYHGGDLDRVLEESRRGSAWLIGPGLGKSKKVGSFIEKLIPELDLPLVIDADGLFFCQRLFKEVKGECILTPHRGEMHRLLGEKGLSLAELLSRCQAFCEEIEVTLLLKGVPTYIFHPGTLPLVVMQGDPGMATAGSGDVLAGVIAALLAKQIKAREAAALGAYLHALAGKYAAARLHSYSLIASDLIEAMPYALTFNSVKERGKGGSCL